MRRTPRPFPRLAVATASAALLASTAFAPTASAAPAQVPCPRDAGTDHYECSWYTAGNGKSAGTPVQAPSGARVGFLHQGRNWIVCQQRGSRVTKGKSTNVWWGLTKADNLKTGWANAVYAQGGANDGQFKGVPNCAGKHGSAPVTKAAPTPPPVTPPVPTPPPAPSGPSRATLAKVVKAVTYEQVYGPKYGKFKRQYPQGTKPNTIIWAKDGCSVPAAAYAAAGPAGAVALKAYSDRFKKSCDRHDFGYRNYGTDEGGLALDPTEKRRASIDNQLHKNLDHQCNKLYGGAFKIVPREACFQASDVFYKMVRGFGASAFH